MRAWEVTVFDKPLELAERPTPKPEGAEVLIEIKASGVCHSDVHIHEGFFDFGTRKMMLAERGQKLPLTLGHEIAGTVVAAGPDAAPIAIGSTRVVFPWIGCGECAVCQRGDEQLCMKPRSIGLYRNGGYATHVLVPHARYCLEIGALKPEQAAPYACSGLTTYSALRKIDPAVLVDAPILVIGAGGLGLMCLSLLKKLGGKGAIVADIDAGKRAAALKAGALAVVDSGAPDALAQVKAAAGGVGVWATIDLVGAPATMQLAIDASLKGAEIIVVGLIGGAITIPIPLIPQKALRIQGSYTGSLGELAELMDLVKGGAIDPIPTTVRPLAEANAALMDLKAGKVVGRTVLRPEA
jgi:D-arabinose 1-dehydrogenase-like Zn-dependent alcohol dehydrogenase